MGNVAAAKFFILVDSMRAEQKMAAESQRGTDEFDLHLNNAKRLAFKVDSYLDKYRKGAMEIVGQDFIQKLTEALNKNKNG